MAKALRPGPHLPPAASVVHENGKAVTSPIRARPSRGFGVDRRNTRDGQTAAEVLDAVEWTRRPAKISGADGEIVFKMDDAEVPKSWSQLATDVAVSKYFRKAGVPGKSGAEESVRELVHRVAHTLRVA